MCETSRMSWAGCWLFNELSECNYLKLGPIRLIFFFLLFCPFHKCFTEKCKYYQNECGLCFGHTPASSGWEVGEFEDIETVLIKCPSNCVKLVLQQECIWWHFSLKVQDHIEAQVRLTVSDLALGKAAVLLGPPITKTSLMGRLGGLVG